MRGEVGGYYPLAPYFYRPWFKRRPSLPIPDFPASNHSQIILIEPYLEEVINSLGSAAIVFFRNFIKDWNILSVHQHFMENEIVL